MEYVITLSQMEFHAYHGCYDLEQRAGNRFSVELKITTELGDAAEKDDVALTVNYLTVYQTVDEQMRRTQRTIERVAMNIIEALHSRFAQIKRVECSVSKLAPPLGGKIRSVSVTLTK